MILFCQTENFYCRGEYFVLDGALALALPLKVGQGLKYTLKRKATLPIIHWKSLNQNKNVWFEGTFSIEHFQTISTTDVAMANRLTEIFQAIKTLDPKSFESLGGYTLMIETDLGFDPNFGFGTSSTLITNLSQCFGVDPFKLLELTFGGSGYDIACAQASGPILYQKYRSQSNFVHIPFNPTFRSHLFFVFLGKKQNSRLGIQHYRNLSLEKEKMIQEISELTGEMFAAKDLNTFELVIQKHEALISQHLQLEQVKGKYFGDYWGEVKSLGAWGGDFVMATSNRGFSETKNYFKSKGMSVIFTYDDLVL